MIHKLFGIFMVLQACIGLSVMAQGSIALEEHKMLKMDEGEWNAQISIWRDSESDPIQSTVKETNSMLGELWSIGKMEGNIAGAHFVGFATLGYDPMQKKYVGTWIDSVTPVITQMEGTYDPKTKTLTLFYFTFGQNGEKEERKNVMVYKDHNTRNFMMYIKNGGEWTRAMAILYKRIK